MRHELVWTGDWFKPRFDRFLDEAFPRNFTPQEFSPNAEIEETENGYLVAVDIPGVKKENIHLEVTGNYLVITGERKSERDETKGSVHFTERSYGKFERAFELSSEVDSEKVEAAYQDGVLKVAIPKAEKAKKKQIQIKDAEKSGLFEKLVGRKEN